MSLYNDKLTKVQTAILHECKERIEENFSQLDMWLSIEDWEFPHIYEIEFNKEFSQYISQDESTKTTILYAGANLTYFVSTITTLTKDIKKIKKLVDEFIRNQINDFHNACEYISMTMYNENNPDIDEMTVPVVQNQPGDDNPS
jgi:hypothetical protein